MSTGATMLNSNVPPPSQEKGSLASAWHSRISVERFYINLLHLFCHCCAGNLVFPVISLLRFIGMIQGKSRNLLYKNVQSLVRPHYIQTEISCSSELLCTFVSFMALFVHFCAVCCRAPQHSG
ncbi:hypothetical protein GDO78_020987 [Eleutherodactylus coqui]|uniref:Uncharacterized protein n=1 Tax=Eleutherodactylus coqui TaxID=57060 RepID=A0A8J6B623_ELECQ|nr:hypothetical protein GDO78_020987 [Eleutherodactylus coqui]